MPGCPEIVKRYDGNPILAPKDIPGGADTVLCLATAKLDDLVEFALKH